MFFVLLSLIVGLPTIDPTAVYRPRPSICGYIAHDEDQQDTWVRTDSDHCSVLQQEAIETYWEDIVIEMEDKHEISPHATCVSNCTSAK